VEFVRALRAGLLAFGYVRPRFPRAPLSRASLRVSFSWTPRSSSPSRSRLPTPWHSRRVRSWARSLPWAMVLSVLFCAPRVLAPLLNFAFHRRPPNLRLDRRRDRSQPGFCRSARRRHLPPCGVGSPAWECSAGTARGEWVSPFMGAVVLLAQLASRRWAVREARVLESSWRKIFSSLRDRSASSPGGPRPLQMVRAGAAKPTVSPRAGTPPARRSTTRCKARLRPDSHDSAPYTRDVRIGGPARCRPGPM
jgi:hypothetical protein